MVLRLCVLAIVASCAFFSFGQRRIEAAPPTTPRAEEVSGDIGADTTWTEAGGPYEVTSLLRVLEDVTLTIEPGVQVIVAEATYIVVEGSLVAEGTASDPITFSGSTPQSGWWYGIQVSGSQDKPASVIFDYVTVQHAGHDSLLDRGALDFHNASVTIRNSIFRDNGGNGIYGTLSGPIQIEDSTFTNNGFHAIHFETGRFDPQLSNLTASNKGVGGEGYNAVVYDTISWEEGDHLLEPMGLPYVFLGAFSVASQAQLTMQPGIEVQVDTNFSINGELVAVGTSSLPIVITGIDKTPGGWNGLSIAGDFGAPAAAQLEHVTLDYGGSPGFDLGGNLMVSMANVTVRNSIISNGGSHGIYNSGGAPTEPTSLLVEETTIIDNAGNAIVCDDESCNQTLNNLVATGNALDAIVQRSRLSGNGIWNKNGLPYVVEESSGINANGSLVIEPGVEVRMSEDTSFDVRGALHVMGTFEQPVIFTGTQEEPGWWEGISVSSAGFLELHFCEVGYGGAPNIAMVQMATSNVFISHCRLHHSAEAAVRTITDANPNITLNRFEENGAGVINGNGGITPVTVDARNNWWGSPSGPAHASNPGGTGNSVSDRVLYDPWLASPDDADDLETLVVQIGGAGRYSSGQTVQYAIAYFNPTTEPVEDAVLRVALPANSTYIDSTGEAIYWPQRDQLFWKLGDLAPGASGLMAMRVTYAWGLPEGLMTAVVAQLGGRNVDASLFNVDEYLAYVPRVQTAVADLSESQIETLRGGDPEMDAIYDQAEADGYHFGSATEQSYSSGEKLTQVILVKVEKEDLFAYLIWRQEAGTVGVAVDGSGLIVHKADGSVRFSLQTKQWQAVTAGEAGIAQAISWNDCMINCIEEKLPGEIAEQLVKELSVAKKAIACVQAINGDESAVLDCSKIVGDAIPGYDIGVELGTCKVDCDECVKNGEGCDDDNCHCCKTDKVRCSSDDWIYGTFGIDVIKRRECRDGKYLPEKVERVCALCTKCVMSSGTPVCVAKNPTTVQASGLALTWVDLGLAPVRADLTLVSASGDLDCEECRIAKDPNAITGPEGDLLPGQVVTYTIEYENVGAGTAFGVFIVNPLSEHFDLDTLTVQDPEVDFSLSKATRHIYFSVGELSPKGEAGSKGQVTYSVQLKPGLPSGTVILNEAVVHFPSVPEETPTNTAVNTIQPIAIPSQHLQVVAGQPLPITLHAEDISGGALSYALAETPLYGELTGTPPALTYTAHPTFAGIDRLRFTADNGTVTSRTGEVVIEVLPAGGDSTAPSVKWTGPTAGATIDSSELVANLADGGLYSPYIQIQFSEAMAAATINTTTVEVKDGAGQIVPVSVQYDATLDQAVVLMHEQGESGATYTVTVKTGVTDLSGNPLAANYVWSFHFGNLRADTPNLYLPSTHR
jgi:uncharacterized repeat protein (TIGR01451 family)